MARADYDVIVIGSGIGGLTAALAAARTGQRVVVLEALKQFGGYLNPFARKRFSFDTGLHYVGEAHAGGLLRRVFDAVGVDPAFNELSPDGFDWYVFPEYQVKLGKGFEQFYQRLRCDFPHETTGLDRFFKILHQVDRAFSQLNRLQGPSPWQVVRHLPAMLRWQRATFADLLDACFRERNLKCALAGPCGDLGLPPSRISALFHLGLLCHFLKGGYYPRGGSGAIRDAYVTALTECGTELRRNSPVQRIVQQSGRAIGVVTDDGEYLSARAVISNAEAVTTYRMAGLGSGSRRLSRKLARIEPSHGSFIVFLGVKGDLPHNRVGDNNVWHYASGDIEAIYRRIREGGQPAPEMLFITIPSIKDPTGNKAPTGHHVVELITLTSARPFSRWFGEKSMKRGPEYLELKQRLAAPMIAVAERYIPGLSESTLVCDIATPATNAHYVYNETGSIYGPAHTPSQVMFGRFTPKTPLAGLFLCGSSTFGAGITTCAHSGYLAGQLTNRYLSR